MIGTQLKGIAHLLQNGHTDPVEAGRLIEAHADTVIYLEQRFAAMENAARASVLNGIGLMASLTELENAIPRPPREVDGTPESSS